MLRRPTSRHASSRLLLTTSQRAAIDDVAHSLPAALRNSFLLRVGSALKISSLNNWVSDLQVSQAIDGALRQLQIAG